MSVPASADLELAATWLESYESEAGDDAAERCQRVAAYLRSLVARRALDARLRETLTAAGIAPSRASLAKLRKLLPS